MSAPAGSDGFYAALPPLAGFGEVADPARYAPLPADWHVATCDVRNSTKAVEAGQYKNVNTVGAAAVTAVLNAAGVLDIPFIFEGDGSAFCVPPSLLEDAKGALVKTQQMAQSSFGLELRVATVPVATIRAAGADILVARIRVSENYTQAAFAGGGMHGLINEKPKVPVMCNFGETDHSPTLAQAKEIAAAHPEITAHYYANAGHGFNCDQRGSYHAESAKLARSRALAFLARHVG